MSPFVFQVVFALFRNQDTELYRVNFCDSFTVHVFLFFICHFRIDAFLLVISLLLSVP